MDSLKQLVAARLKAQVPGHPHPDAEVLSAFAENALAPKDRQVILEHVGVCADCREILFLAAPLHADTQQTFAVKKSWTPFALRWGAVAASVVIAAAVMGRHELRRTYPIAKMPAEMHSAAPSAAENTIAREKAPAELDAMSDRQVATKVAPPAAPSGHAEPKAITAKPQASMAFEKSGQVSVAQSSEDVKLEAEAKDLPTGRRDANDQAQLTLGAASASPGKQNTAVGGAVGGVISYGAAGSNAPALRKDGAAFHGFVSGTISDASGAVIPNAKVTATGPLGERTATSDPAGRFSLDHLAAGTYAVKVDVPGFHEAQSTVAVLDTKPATTDFKLEAGSTNETVEVSASAVAVAVPAVTDAIVKDKDNVKDKDDKDKELPTANGTQIAQAQSEEARSTGLETVEVKKQKSAKTRKAAPVAARALALSLWQWSLSPEGAVQRSSDQGKTWQEVSVAEGATFRAIWADGEAAWAGGNGGALYHSTDSGQHWTQVVPTANSEKLQADITRIDFSGALRGTVSTANGQAWTTTDGGQTWIRK